MKTNFKMPHCIDEANGIVYVLVRSWAGAMGASHQGKRVYPDYEIKFVSEQKFNELTKDYERIN